MFDFGLYREKHEKIFSSETIRPRALIFCMKHHLVDLYQVFFQIMDLGQKWPCPGGLMFYIGLLNKLSTLLNLSSWCLVMVERLFLVVPWGCLQFVIVVFPDHTHYFLYRKT